MAGFFVLTQDRRLALIRVDQITADRHMPILDLSTVGLTPEQRERRRRYIGGSDATIIATGTPEDLIALWREKRGEGDRDFGGFSLPALMGNWTEPLNLAWFQHQTGLKVTHVGEARVSPHFDFMSCTLDGFTYGKDGNTPTVIQCKHLNEWYKKDDIIRKCMPQITHEMAVTGAERATLSVIQGSATWWAETIELDRGYLSEILNAELKFWDHVKDGTPPAEIHNIEPVVAKVVDFRTVDMTAGNAASEWQELAKAWLEQDPYVSARKKTDKGIKAMLAEDVGQAHGAGIIVTRNKAGHLTINSEDQPKRRRT